MGSFPGKKKQKYEEKKDGDAGAPPEAKSSAPEMKAQASFFEKVEVKKEKITKTYNVGKGALGQGGFGKVTKGNKKGTNEHRAIKQLPKGETDQAALMTELVIGCKLDHPNIVKLYEVFEDSNSYYLVLELATGGELFDAIVDAAKFNEWQAAHIQRQVMRGIYYMHTKCICHRDVKAENFLLYEKKPIEECTIKIIDFGIAMEFQPGVPMTGSSGTPYYIAPEVLDGKYDCTCDEWACGVLLYIMLTGEPPFHGKCNRAILQSVQRGLKNGWQNGGNMKKVSDSGKDLIGNLICLDPSKRCTAEKSLEHPWIKQVETPCADQAVLETDHLSNLKAFASESKLKKAALHAIARRMNDKDIGNLKKTFEALDKNQDGVVTYLELQEGVDKLPGASPEMKADLEGLMKELDVDGSQSIDYTEFIAGTLSKRMFQEENVLWSAFSVFDKDGSGKINRTELEAVLKSEDVKDLMGKDAESVKKALESQDTNGDGQIDFKEFMAMMRS